MTKSSRHEYPMKNKLGYSIEYKLNSSRPVSKKKKEKRLFIRYQKTTIRAQQNLLCRSITNI